MSIWEWLMTGGVGVDWFIGLSAFGCLICIAMLIGQMYEKDNSDV